MANYENRFERMSSDTIGDTIARAVMSLTRAMEPRINEMAAEAAHRAVREGQKVAHDVYRRVRSEPWYLIGIAAALLVTAAVFFKASTRDVEELDDYQEHGSLH